MKYNIGFTLGDPRGDGHACTTDYHIVANHSADEISKAYKETTKLLGFDFIKEVGVDFQSNYWIPERFTKELLKLGIIDEKYVRELDAEWGAPAGCYEFDYAEEEFVDLYFAIVKYSLPDLEWSSRDLEEETLWEDDTYKVLNGELYKCDDTQYPEDTSYLVDVRSNGDGTYKYIAQFYNGGTWLNGVLEEGLNNLK